MRSSFFAFVLCLSAAMPLSAQAQWGSQPSEGGWGSTPQGRPVEPVQSTPLSGQGPPQSEGGLALRLSNLENQIRALNGKIEQLEFKNRTLEDQLKKFQEDAEFRFQAVEGGKKGGATSPPRRQQRSEAAPRASASAVPLPSEEEGGDSDDGMTVSPAPQDIGDAGPSSSGPQLGALPQALGQLNVDSEGAPVELNPNTVSQPLEPLPGAITEEARPGYMPKSRQQLASAGSNTPKDQYDLAYGYMLRGDYEMAEVSFKDFLGAHPADGNAAQAAYWLGESQYQRKQYKTAAESFLKVYNDHPSAPKAPESLLRLGMSLKMLGQKDAACASYAEVIRKYPKAGAAVKKRVQTEQKSAGC